MSAKSDCAFPRGQDHLARARDKANFLVQRESRGPGDTENAMRRVERKRGVPFNLLWALRYRPPKDIFVSAFLKIENAFLQVAEEERGRLDASIKTSRAVLGLNAGHSLAVRAGVALAGEKGTPE